MQDIFLANNIKYLRKAKNITQMQIAKLCNKTDVTIYHWENGKREPNAVDLGKLSQLFRVSVSDLLFKDLKNESPGYDLDYLYSEYKHLLTEEDREMIKFIIEKRIKNGNS